MRGFPKLSSTLFQVKFNCVPNGSLTIDVDLDGGGHGSVGDGLVLGGAPELAEEVVAAELEPDLVAAGAGAVGLLEGARLACVCGKQRV